MITEVQISIIKVFLFQEVKGRSLLVASKSILWHLILDLSYSNTYSLGPSFPSLTTSSPTPHSGLIPFCLFYLGHIIFLSTNLIPLIRFLFLYYNIYFSLLFPLPPLFQSTIYLTFHSSFFPSAHVLPPRHFFLLFFTNFPIHLYLTHPLFILLSSPQSTLKSYLPIISLHIFINLLRILSLFPFSNFTFAVHSEPPPFSYSSLLFYFLISFHSTLLPTKAKVRVRITLFLFNLFFILPKTF